MPLQAQQRPQALQVLALSKATSSMRPLLTLASKELSQPVSLHFHQAWRCPELNDPAEDRPPEVSRSLCNSSLRSVCLFMCMMRCLLPALQPEIAAKLHNLMARSSPC